MKTVVLVAAVAVVMATGIPASATPCKDARGKIVKCAAKPAVKKVCKPGSQLKSCAARTKPADPTTRANYRF